MSTRAIASVTGVSNATVSRDRAGVANQTPVTGLDGKVYVRRGRPTSEGMQELAESVPAVRRRRPLPDAYRDALATLEKTLARLERLHADDRFARFAASEPGEALSRRLGDLAQRGDTLAVRLAVRLSATTSRPGDNVWSRKVQNVSATVPIDEFTDDEVEELLGAAEFLFHLCRGTLRNRNPGATNVET